MWILPKQLHTLAYAPDMKGLGLDSETFSQICEKSLTWKGKDSLSRTWLQRWKRNNWMQHLCLRTLKPSHTKSFVDAWTSSLAASRVSLSHLQDCVKQQMIQDTCFHTSQKELESANLELFSSKTLQELSQPKQQMVNQFCNMSSESWKDWVIEQRQEYSQRKKSAHLIRESESTSLAWPTATARDWKGCGNAITRKDGKHRIDNLEAMIKYGHPDQANPNTNGKNRGSWPTPRANKVHPEITEQNREHLANRNKANLEEDIAGHCGKATGKLNPNWVEQLMGLPTGWTQLPTEWID